MSSQRPDEYRRRIYRDYVASLAPSLRQEVSAEALTALDERYRRSFLPLFPADRSARILEIGCGWGRLIGYLRRQGYKNCFGVDRSPASVRRAAELGVEGVSEGDALERLAAEKGTLDCVVAIDVLEHLRKDEVVDFLDAVAAALKPGGTVILQTLNADGISAPRMLYIDFTHETAFTRYSLEQVLSVCGFKEAEFFPLGPIGKGLRAFVATALWRFFGVAMGVYYSVEGGSGVLRNDHILTVEILARARRS